MLSQRLVAAARKIKSSKMSPIKKKSLLSILTIDFTNGMGDDEYEPRTCLNAILSVVCAHVEINNVFNMCHVLVTKQTHRDSSIELGTHTKKKINNNTSNNDEKPISSTIHPRVWCFLFIISLLPLCVRSILTKRVMIQDSKAIAQHFYV